MNVFWTPLASESFQSVIDQLILNWNFSVVERFENQISELINRIENHNHICPKSNIENLHKCVINKHNSLIYRVKNKNTIEIILVIFNQSEHIF